VHVFLFLISLYDFYYRMVIITCCSFGKGRQRKRERKKSYFWFLSLEYSNT